MEEEEEEERKKSLKCQSTSCMTSHSCPEWCELDRGLHPWKKVFRPIHEPHRLGRQQGDVPPPNTIIIIIIIIVVMDARTSQYLAKHCRLKITTSANFMQFRQVN